MSGAPRMLPGVAMLAALAAAAPAQQALGATFRTAASTASRGGLVGSAGILAARFDHDDYVGWGRTTSQANRREVRGVLFQAEDKDGSTPETYSILVYGEDPAQPGYPDVSAPLLAVGPFTTAAGAPGPSLSTRTHVFATPLLVPADRDVFVGVSLAAAPAWPNDGFAVQCLLGATSRWSTFDAPGAPPIQHGSYGLAIDSAGMRFYSSTRQLLVDLLCDAPGGACTAVSQQASFPIGATPPGGGGYLSGLHLDAVAPPAHAGRADDPGFVFLDSSLPAGTPVFFLCDFGTFGPELPLRQFVAGSVGVFCLKSSTITVALGQLQGGQASIVIPVGAGARGVLAGLPLLHQAIALAPGNVLRSSPCGRQLF